MPCVYFKKKLPSDDDINFEDMLSVDGIITEQGQHIFFSPILNNNALTYDLADSDAYLTLSTLDGDEPYSVILYEKSIALTDDEFETQINGHSILRPSEYDEIKAKYEPFKANFHRYIEAYQRDSNNPIFDRTSLKHFLETVPQSHLQKMDFSSNKQTVRQPFYDVDTQKEFDFVSKTVEPTRISKTDIKTFGKENKGQSNQHTFGL